MSQIEKIHKNIEKQRHQLLTTRSLPRGKEGGSLPMHRVEPRAARPPSALAYSVGMASRRAGRLLGASPRRPCLSRSPPPRLTMSNHSLLQLGDEGRRNGDKANVSVRV
jgi:hypothetical protein